MRASKSSVPGAMPRASAWWVRSSTAGPLPTRVWSYRPWRISSGVMTRLSRGGAEVVGEVGRMRGHDASHGGDPVGQPGARPGEPQRRDHRAVEEHRGSDTGEADLELVDRGGVAAGADAVELGGQLLPAGDGVRGELLERSVRPVECPVGVEDLAQGRGVRRQV